MQKIKTIKEGRKTQYVYDDLKFDSKGEVYFYWWVQDLLSEGFIKDIIIHPHPFELFDKVSHSYLEVKKTKNNQKLETLMQPHIYTPDMAIEWNPIRSSYFVESVHCDFKFKKNKLIAMSQYSPFTYIEVKPTFDQNNMTRLFMLNQKWVFDKYNEYVNLVKIDTKSVESSWFALTFVPKRFLLTDAGVRGRAIHYPVKTLGDYLES